MVVSQMEDEKAQNNPCRQKEAGSAEAQLSKSVPWNWDSGLLYIEEARARG